MKKFITFKVPISQNGQTLTQIIHWLLRTNCLSAFDHFVGLALKDLSSLNFPVLKFHV